MRTPFLNRALKLEELKELGRGLRFPIQQKNTKVLRLFLQKSLQYSNKISNVNAACALEQRLNVFATGKNRIDESAYVKQEKENGKTYVDSEALPASI